MAVAHGEAAFCVTDFPKVKFSASGKFPWIFIYFYFICHTIITKNIGKEEKKKWWGDLTETIGAYERLRLLELWARAVSHPLKKRRRKVEDGKVNELFSYLLNINLIFSFFLKNYPSQFPNKVLLANKNLRRLNQSREIETCQKVEITCCLRAESVLAPNWTAKPQQDFERCCECFSVFYTFT